MGKKHGSVKYGIVFVADHWGKCFGGVDAFNEDLCKAMAYVVDHSSVAVICLIFGTVETHYIGEYREKGIYIVDYTESENEDKIESCNGARKEVLNAISCESYIWIGHDLHTGEQAFNLSNAKNKKEKCAVIFHTDYFSMHIDQPDVQRRKKTGIDYNTKSQMQEELARKADWVFCIGPVVYERFKNLHNVFEIIPGLDANLLKNNPGEYKLIMTAGRFSQSTEYQKKWTEVCYAIGEALDYMIDHGTKPLDYKVLVCGFCEDYGEEEIERKRKKIISDIQKQTKNNIQITIDFHNFDSERTNYLKKLAKSNIFVMGSWKESFGMVAWEALSMGIPIVVSESSGVYQYMEKELGYLLKGLCGSFEAGRENSTKEMGRAIADILLCKDGIKKSTELLQKEMSKRNKWEILAIKIAEIVGIDNVMSADIFHNQECFEFTYAERKLMLDELKKRVQSKKISDKIIFFDGISSKNILQDKFFFVELIKMMHSEGKERVEVYLCYPTEKAIDERIAQIDEENVDAVALKEKAVLIAELKKTIYHIWKESDIDIDEEEFIVCLDRIHLVPLDKSPSVYINIFDDDWYFTIKYEKRSSENATMKLQLTSSDEGIRQKKNLIEHMKFILNASNDTVECQNLLQQIDKW